MSIIAASLYRNGKRIGPVSLDQPVRCATDRSEFVWIGLFEPSEAELRQLQENYDLHPLAIEDALLAHQLPKLDIYGDQLFVVARPAHLADGEIRYGETAVFVGDTFIISVRHGSERAHSGLRQQLESSPGLLQHGVRGGGARDRAAHTRRVSRTGGNRPAVHPAPRVDPLPARAGADARGMQQADAYLASG